jgi:hypothetical protein
VFVKNNLFTSRCSGGKVLIEAGQPASLATFITKQPPECNQSLAADTRSLLHLHQQQATQNAPLIHKHKNIGI